MFKVIIFSSIQNQLISNNIWKCLDFVKSQLAVFIDFETDNHNDEETREQTKESDNKKTELVTLL